MNFLKNFKKITLSSLVLSLAVLIVPKAQAQQHHELNFLASCTSVVVSNTLSWTNLQTTAVGATTNVVNMIYTNLLGNQVVVAAGDTTQLATDIPLWSDRNGNIPVIFPGYTNGVYDNPLSAMSVNINLARCGSGVSTTAILFQFVPMMDGVHESTASGDVWAVAVTPAASKTVNVSTNVPVWLWPNAKKLRLRSITSTRGAASGDVAVDSVTLNGFVP